MMTAAGEREGLAQLGEDQGWRRRISDERADVYLKGSVRIRLVWAGDQISGATLFHDQMYESYTRESATIRAWLKR